MVIITIAFGQCGNQLANTLFQYLYEDAKYFEKNTYSKLKLAQHECDEYEMDAMKRWFSISKRGKVSPRTILVDTESKVIDSLLKNRMFVYQRYVKKSIGGAANNWAQGYYDIGEYVLEDILDEVRREIEHCNRTIGFLTLHSTSGGTGSGVGSYVMERIRDEYPNTPITSCLVLPYQNGELVTQNYNTILTVKKLYDICDVCVLFHNEQLQNLIEKLLKVTRIDFDHINRVIVQKIASVFQPAGSNRMWNVVDTVVSHPSYKLAQIKTSPFTAKINLRYEASLKWTELITHAKQMLRAGDTFDWEAKYASTMTLKNTEEYLKSVSNYLITRGKVDNPLNVSTLENPKLYARWIPDKFRFKYTHQNRVLNGEPRYITLVTNNSSLYKHVEGILEQAWLMFSHDACLHQYAKYGLEKDLFNEVFLKVENIIKTYKDLEKE